MYSTEYLLEHRHRQPAPGEAPVDGRAHAITAEAGCTHGADFSATHRRIYNTVIATSITRQLYKCKYEVDVVCTYLKSTILVPNYKLCYTLVVYNLG